MTLRVETVTIDAADPWTLAAFWAELLDFEKTYEDADSVAISPRGGGGPTLLLYANPDRAGGGAERGKNPVHLDLAPDDRDAEVERALSLGATRVDIGQTGDESWVVLADPEGNEFCILSSR